MTIIQSVFLGIIQGITEFLPVSSSGHLTLLQHFFNIQEPPLFFNIMVHAGTLMATLVYFRSLIWEYINGIIKNDKDTWRKIGIIIVATIPAGFIGVILEMYLEGIFKSLLVVGFGFLFTALFLRQLHQLSINKDNKQTTDSREQATDRSFSAQKATKDMRPISITSAFTIGAFQALALLPGITRSGSTILAGKMQNLSIEEAFDFSFIISIPAITGALVLQLLSFESQTSITPGIIGGVTAAIIGYVSLHLLKKVIVKRKLLPFAWYCLGLSALTFAIALI